MILPANIHGHVEVDDHTAIGGGGGRRDDLLRGASHRSDGSDTLIRTPEGNVQVAGPAVVIAVKVISFIVNSVHHGGVQEVLVAIIHLDGGGRFIDAGTGIYGLRAGLSLMVHELGPGGLQRIVVVGAQLDGPILLLDGEVAQLRPVVIAPAEGIAFVVDYHGVVVTGADILNVAQAAVRRHIGILAPDYLHRSQLILVQGGGGCLTGSVHRIDAQLSLTVLTPAVDVPILGHQQAEASAGGDLDHILDVARQLIARRVQTDGGHLYGQKLIPALGPQAKLAVIVVPPAINLSPIFPHSIGSGIHHILPAQGQHKVHARVHGHNVLQSIGSVVPVGVPVAGIIIGHQYLSALGLVLDQYRVGIALTHGGTVGALALLIPAPGKDLAVGAQGHVHVAVHRDIHNVVEILRPYAQAVADPLGSVVRGAGIAHHIAAHAGAGVDIVAITRHPSIQTIRRAPTQDRAVFQQDQGVEGTYRHLDNAGEVALFGGDVGIILHPVPIGIKGVPEGAVSRQYPQGHGTGVPFILADTQLAILVVAPSVYVASG